MEGEWGSWEAKKAEKRKDGMNARRHAKMAYPEPRVNWTFQQTLPDSPLFTWVSSLPTFKPSVYGNFQYTCPQTPN